MIQVQVLGAGRDQPRMDRRQPGPVEDVQLVRGQRHPDPGVDQPGGHRIAALADADPGIAVHPRLIAAGDERLELDHYLEILVRKPGALPGSAALAQARAAGVFTSAHEALWSAARARHGDAAGTRALIEVLLLHRRMPASQVIAGITAALAAGSCSPDVVAVEARKHPAADSGSAAGAAWPAIRPRPSRAAVVTLPTRRDPLPPDKRPAPSVAAYDQLLAPPVREEGA